MRVLFSTTAGAGHLGPLVPLARACQTAGHEVVVAAPVSFADPVRRVGFEHMGFPEAPPEALGRLMAGLENLSLDEANARMIQDVFGRLDACAALPGMTGIIERCRPDVVVREMCEFGSLAAAELVGVPHVQVALGMHELCDRAEPLLAQPLAELGALVGMTDGRLSAALHDEPVFSTVPERLDEPYRHTPTDAAPRMLRFRDASLSVTPGSLPGHWGKPTDPLVYVTFGSVAGSFHQSGGLFASTLEALAELPVRVLLTTGESGDPDALRPWPDNAHVERWWPQVEVMPHAAVVVGHGGFGTTMTALAAGVPQVVVPLFASDQVLNAERIAAAGAGVHVDGGTGSAASICDAVTELLTHLEYGARARTLAAEMARLPEVAEAVPVLAELCGAG
ncbi:hypothetical protein N865_17565 [Intrasporangium oryzae NRRL B-24470]|uniref:Erythromycin biosynthesis protein CIII-like C-terminal domain-containing protein n=1 Tax=Intrasporangium oryzae NRRL B-24470 TaxID=1386089 RepID=W9G8L8_9MICO|nr:glycosyltransferase [Intrasporangium oryzae]EWT00219.1 hypothetical protein N865_17565 [Intrasporangium oryzae NRRL B-24470]